MKKVLIGLVLVLIVGLGAWAFLYNYSKNSQEVTTFKTTHAFRTDIQTTAVATGEVKPNEEIEIKPNISGVIDKIAVEEGEIVEVGQLIASIKVVPDVNSLNSAKLQIKSAKIRLANETRNFNRQKTLYNQGVISRSDYETALASYDLAKQDLTAANDNYKVAQTGIAPGLERYATTQIRSTIHGMILDIPVEIGNMVQEINNFSEGTTIARVADVNNMIFEGKVDEADVGKLEEEMDIEVTIGALPDEVFTGKLTFISPSGEEENGVVEFDIEAKMTLKEDVFVRAGYSANAKIVTQSKEGILALKESEVQYDEDGKPFVEIKDGEKWDKKEVRVGVSDGINVEILGGITEKDKIKIPNTDLKEMNSNQRGG